MEQLECMCLVNDNNMGSFTKRAICSSNHYAHIYCLQAYYEAILTDEDIEITYDKLLKCPFGGKAHKVDITFVCSIFREIKREDLESHIQFYTLSKV